jgi:thioesterase domain-containing protein
MTTINTLQTMLRENIPLASPMRLEIAYLTDVELAIRAPLAPNGNDKGTGFAGSLYSAMVLAGWCCLLARTRDEGIDAQVALLSADVRYLKPVTDDFQAACKIPEAPDWARFVTKLKKRKNYEIRLSFEVTVGGEVKAAGTGNYIAWLSRPKEND